MADLGQAYVQIVPKATGIKGKITQAISPEATMAGTQAGAAIGTGIGNKLSSMGGSMIRAGAIATAVSVPIIKGIKSAMSAYQLQNAAETKLTEIYKSRMGATEAAAKSTMKLASALQKEGVVGDEVTLSGAQQLATFAKYPETVNSLLPSMQNLLVQQKGLNGTTQDATQIANLMGKVMMGQTGALKRVGVSFTEAEEKVLKYGTEQEKAAMLAKVITNNVGEMNKAMLETPEGKIQQMKNAFGDLAEKLGATLAPALADIANWLSNNLIPKIDALMTKIQGSPIAGKVVAGIAGITAAGGPLLIIVGTLMKAFGGLFSSIGGSGAAVGGLANAFKFLTGPLGIATTLFTVMFTKSESFRTAIINLVKSVASSLMPLIKQIVPVIQTIMTSLSKLVVEIGNALAPVIQRLIPVIQQVVTVVAKVVSEVAKAVVPIIQQLMPIIQSIATTVAAVMSKILAVVIPVVQKILSVVVPVVQKILSVVVPVMQKILSVVSSVLGKVKSVFSSVFGVINSIVKKSVNGVKASIGGIKSVISTVGSVFEKIKSKMTKPIEVVRDTIKKAIDKIKGFFHFTPDTPKIKLPHFSISPKGWKMKDLLKGKIPHLSIKWAAKGGIVDGATLVGAGEKGQEAIVPLDPFWKKMDKMAETMNGGGDTFNTTLVYEAGDDANDMLRDLARGIKRYRRAGAF